MYYDVGFICRRAYTHISLSATFAVYSVYRDVRLPTFVRTFV